MPDGEVNGFVVDDPHGAGNPALRIDNSNHYILLSPSYLSFKVGIGTPTPTEALDITGNAKATGTIYAAQGFIEPTITPVVLNSTDYNPPHSGVFQVLSGSLTNKFKLPNATTYDGQSFKVSVLNGEVVTFDSASDIWDKATSAIGDITIIGGSTIFTAIGGVWQQF